MAPTCRSSVPQQPPSTVSWREVGAQPGVPLGKVGRVALVELVRLVELGVAHGRGVRPQSADPVHPGVARRSVSAKWVGWAQLIM